MFFGVVKLVRKINIFVENGCSLHCHELKKWTSGYSVAVFFVAQQNGGEWFTRNKKTRLHYVPKHGFWAPKKGSGKSFLVKLAYFGHFHELQNYTCLRWFLLTNKIGGENTPNCDFLTPENGHKSHFSTQNGLFFGVLTHLLNSLPYIFWWNFLLPIKIGCEEYGRKKFHEEMVSENMFFWLVKVVRKINIFVKNGCSLHFH